MVMCLCEQVWVCAVHGTYTQELCPLPSLHPQGGTSLPADFNAWSNLITALVNNFIARYGLGEVRQWRFEVGAAPDAMCPLARMLRLASPCMGGAW